MNGKNLPDPSRILAVIMGGGRGTRLFPLTLSRAKPAVPVAGKYRLVDIPISNCIHSGIRRIFVLTQFNSASLHRHVNASFRFDRFDRGFVEILAAEQTPTSSSWYEGTADAVRKNLHHFEALDFDYVLVLSGDQLYRMNFQDLFRVHLEKNAEITIATKPIPRSTASSFGIMRLQEDGRILQFVEKPHAPEILNSLRLSTEAAHSSGIENASEVFLASMGIYLFNREILFKVLSNDSIDFAKHIIPDAIQTHRVYAYVFEGYWEDIGTIRSFFEANLDLTTDLPRFNFFDPDAPIYTRPRSLPPSKINGASLDHVVVADGCLLNQCSISYSIIGLRTFIEKGTVIHRSIIMGADYYETTRQFQARKAAALPPIGIGPDCRIENAIVDKNVRIGRGCIITPEGKPPHMDHDLFYIREGIIIIPKNQVIPDGTVL